MTRLVATQLRMFDAIPPRFPRVRRRDPRSSHDAAAEVETKGIAKRQALEVLAALRAHTGSTSKELSRASGLDYHTVARRLPELATARLVRKVEKSGDTVPCAVCGRAVIRWWVV